VVSLSPYRQIPTAYATSASSLTLILYSLPILPFNTTSAELLTVPFRKAHTNMTGNFPTNPHVAYTDKGKGTPNRPEGPGGGVEE
jgi:hypothetical protein